MLKAPTYDLDTVIAAAAAEHVTLSRNATRDADNLDFSFSEVCVCIAGLKPGDFEKSIDYGGYVLDVYLPRVSGPGDRIDRIYVKLRTFPDRTVGQVYLASFHL